jgi:hypothetical protein
MIEKPDMDKAIFCRVVQTPEDGEIRFPKFPLTNTGLTIVARKLHWRKAIYF